MTYQESPYQQVNIVDQNGNIISSLGGGGSGGDASAAKQDQQTSVLQAIQTEIGNTDINGTTLPSGGQGLRGWVSAIWKLLGDRLPNLTSSGRIPVELPTGAATDVTLGQVRDRLPPSLSNNRLNVDGSGVTQPISAANLPLPAGAATDASVSAISAKIPNNLATDRITATAPFAFRLTNGTSFINPTTPSDTQPVIVTALPPLPTGTNLIGSVTQSGTWTVNANVSFPATQSVSANALPLPQGASTDATLAQIRDRLPSALSNNRLSVDGSGVTQPISASNLPLPAGAATDTTLAQVRDRLPSSGVLSEGTDITGAIMPAGGSGARGWYSALWKVISDRLPYLVNGKIPVDASGGIVASTASRSIVNASTSISTILAANSNRKKAIFKNTSTTLIWYLIYGSGGSGADYTVDLLPGDVWSEINYLGLVNGVCSGATAANLLITELT